MGGTAEQYIIVVPSGSDMIGIPTSLTDLYELFQKQPFGLKKGLIPVLLATFFMTKHGSFALYNTDEQGKEFFGTMFHASILAKKILKKKCL